MRRIPLLLALVLLPSSPAWANWGKTHWGMTLEQVLAAVPDARPLKREGTAMVWGRERLASAPYKLGQFATTADFFFSTRGKGLEFVKMEPADPKQCGAFEAMLVKRHGAGQRESFDKGVHMIVIRWTERKTKEQLLYSAVNKPGEPVMRCHFIQQAPA